MADSESRSKRGRNVYLPEEQWAWLAQRAAEDRRSANGVIELLIADAMEREAAPTTPIAA